MVFWRLISLNWHIARLQLYDWLIDWLIDRSELFKIIANNWLSAVVHRVSKSSSSVALHRYRLISIDQRANLQTAIYCPRQQTTQCLPATLHQFNCCLHLEQSATHHKDSDICYQFPTTPESYSVLEQHSHRVTLTTFCLLLYWRTPSVEHAVLMTWRQTSLSLAFLQAVWTSKFNDWRSSSIVLSQVVLGRPTGLLQSTGGLSAAAMTWWWSSLGAVRARCPKKPPMVTICHKMLFT